MPEKLTWTPKMDAVVRQMRIARASYEEIGRAVGVSRSSIIGRLPKLFPGGVPSVRPPPPENRYTLPQGGLPRDGDKVLVAGDPLTWGLITAGTLLDGVPYPIDPITRQLRT